MTSKTATNNPTSSQNNSIAETVGKTPWDILDALLRRPKLPLLGAALLLVVFVALEFVGVVKVTFNSDVKPHPSVGPAGIKSIHYSMDINGSDLRFPKILDKYNKELFLVGPNQNFLLNTRHNSDNFEKLIASLIDGGRSINILISDPSDKVLQKMYAKVSAKDFNKESSEILVSIKEIDRFIETKFGREKLAKIKQEKLLQIKSVDIYLDTFCFVDGQTGLGSAYFMVDSKGVAGGLRPVVFADEIDHRDLFNFYYELLKKNIFQDATLLWPRD